MEYHQEQYREQQRWLAYILMMQFFAKENMWSLLNQMRIHRTRRYTTSRYGILLGCDDCKKTPPVEYIPDGIVSCPFSKPQLMYVRSERSTLW